MLNYMVGILIEYAYMIMIRQLNARRILPFGMRVSKVNLAFLVICSLCVMVLLVNCFLGDLVLLVIVQLTLPPRSTLTMDLESMSITIMSKGGKLKRNNVLKLYFVSSRNACDSRLLNVLFARKCARFTCESKTSSYGSKIYDLECSTPP